MGSSGLPTVPTPALPFTSEGRAVALGLELGRTQWAVPSWAVVPQPMLACAGERSWHQPCVLLGKPSCTPEPKHRLERGTESYLGRRASEVHTEVPTLLQAPQCRALSHENRLQPGSRVPPTACPTRPAQLCSGPGALPHDCHAPHLGMALLQAPGGTRGLQGLSLRRPGLCRDPAEAAACPRRQRGRPCSQ